MGEILALQGWALYPPATFIPILKAWSSRPGFFTVQKNRSTQVYMIATFGGDKQNVNSRNEAVIKTALFKRHDLFEQSFSPVSVIFQFIRN
jgi:hypothetical protein